MTTKTGVAIVGASGYAARELFRIMREPSACRAHGGDFAK